MKQSINTAVNGSPDDWDVKACLFATQEIGRFSVKFSAPCIGGTVNLNCSHITNACNPFDAVARVSRAKPARRVARCTPWNSSSLCAPFA